MGVEARSNPIILDDSYDLAETAGLSISDDQSEGLAAGTAALLSMSGYGKPHDSGVHDYDSSRPLLDSMYLAYAQQGFPQPHFHSSVFDRQSDQVPAYDNSVYQPRSAFDDSQPFLDVHSRPTPSILSYSPQQGPTGTKIYLTLLSEYDLAATPSVRVEVMLASQRCRSLLSGAEIRDAQYQYLLSADVPSISATASVGPQVPLSLRLRDDSGSDPVVIDVGPYTYMEVNQPQMHFSPHDGSRKRKISLDSNELMRLPVKRISAQQLRPSEDYDTYSRVKREGSAYLQNPQAFAADSSYGGLAPHNRSLSQQSYHQHESPRRRSNHPSTSSASSLSQFKGPSPQTPTWSPSNSIGVRTSKSPALAVTPVMRISSMPSPSTSTNPPLIRTSTLRQSPSPAATPSVAAPFNVYAMVPYKASIKLDGDLQSMTKDWSSEELATKRRLVQFRRAQNVSVINASFERATLVDKPTSGSCISCIRWEEKNDYFVTSVDTILLLEFLVGVRFTVEEKNRIRRNLEGFRPMTVSKGKPDSEEFFKLIMGFPNPKPRNIEKDVKVFPWKILDHALKKIIGKYSASQSSTASALAPPVRSAHSGVQSDLGADYRPLASPHSNPTSTRTSAYGTGFSTVTRSPSGYSAPATFPSTASMLQVSEPSLADAYTIPMGQYQYPQQTPIDTSANAMPITQQPHRGSWEYSNFIETSPTSATPTNAQSIPYPGHPSTNTPASSAQYHLTHASPGG